MKEQETQLTEEQLLEWLERHDTKRTRFPFEVALDAFIGTTVLASNLLSYVESEGARQAFNIIRSEVVAQTRRLYPRATGAELVLFMDGQVETGIHFDFGSG